MSYCQDNNIKFILGGTLPVGRAEINTNVVSILKKDHDLIVNKYIRDNGNFELMDRACRNDCVVVFADGRVTICPLLRKEHFIAGNAKNNELMDIWRNGCKKISDGLIVDSLESCIKCELKYICTGGCPILRRSINTTYPCDLYYNKERFIFKDIK